MQALAKANDPRKLDYKHVADVVQTDDRLDFLREMVPRKITVREFKELLKRKKRLVNGLQTSTNNAEQDSDGSSTSETEEDSEDSSLTDETGSN